MTIQELQERLKKNDIPTIFEMNQTYLDAIFQLQKDVEMIIRNLSIKALRNYSQ